MDRTNKSLVAVRDLLEAAQNVLGNTITDNAMLADCAVDRTKVLHPAIHAALHAARADIVRVQQQLALVRLALSQGQTP